MTEEKFLWKDSVYNTFTVVYSTQNDMLYLNIHIYIKNKNQAFISVIKHEHVEKDFPVVLGKLIRSNWLENKLLMTWTPKCEHSLFTVHLWSVMQKHCLWTNKCSVRVSNPVIVYCLGLQHAPLNTPFPENGNIMANQTSFQSPCKKRNSLGVIWGYNSTQCCDLSGNT